MSTLGAARVLVADVMIPPSGAWWGTVSLDASSLPPLGRTSLTIGDLVLVGSVVRVDWDDQVNGGRPIATVRGGEGWGRPVTRAGSYSSSGGVKLSTVIQDLATMTGEPCGALVDVSLGQSFAWPAHAPFAPFHASDVLADLVRRRFLPTWRVEPFSGRTVWSAWPTLTFADGKGRITSRARDRGRRTVGLDVQVAAFLPGATLEGVAIARTLLHAEAEDLRAEVYDR